MKSNLLFDFSVNKENNTIEIKKEFAADLDMVWDVWTKPEFLDQWWAPKPYQTQTKSMDFRAGGSWLYAMVSPTGDKHWCKNEYVSISPKTSYIGLDAFCDENGLINANMPRTQWTNQFIELQNKTLVSITAQYENLADLEKIIQFGFKEGFTMAIGNLDELITTLIKSEQKI